MIENQTQELTGRGMRTIRHALIDATETLQMAAVETARLDAEVLLRHVLNIDTTQLYSDLDSLLDAADDQTFQNLISRRAKREPTAYITGHKEFWSLDFLVNRNVLIPRPETELLVEVALGCLQANPLPKGERIRDGTGKRNSVCDPLAQPSSLSSPASRGRMKEGVRILDIGTGSGAIAIALAAELPQAEIWTVDVSTAALDLARINAVRHGVEERIQLVCGDVFEGFEHQMGMFDLIVSNPPYIKTEELAHLAPEIRQWEPVIALDGGVDGLTYYRPILDAARNHLPVGGRLLFETDPNLAGSLSDLFQRYGEFGTPVVYQDYAGNDRVISATRTSPQSRATMECQHG